MLQAQVSALLHAWEWKSSDRIYNVLPLHHVHGVVNVVTCALASGACVEMPPRFDAEQTVNHHSLALSRAYKNCHIVLLEYLTTY
jgi:malonyl-CoA/methylmalonyl-CoA synthetase